MHIHSTVQGWAALPAVIIWRNAPCMLLHAAGTTRDSKPQLWTGHPSPRFRNKPYHATTTRPLSQDPSILYDGQSSPPRRSWARLLSRCSAGTSAGDLLLFRSLAPRL